MISETNQKWWPQLNWRGIIASSIVETDDWAHHFVQTGQKSSR